MMDKFLFFAYSAYYPSGGMSDYKATFDDLNSAQSFMPDNYHTYHEIYHVNTNKLYSRTRINYSKEYTEWKEESMENRDE